MNDDELEKEEILDLDDDSSSDDSIDIVDDTYLDEPDHYESEYTYDNTAYDSNRVNNFNNKDKTNNVDNSSNSNNYDNLNNNYEKNNSNNLKENRPNGANNGENISSNSNHFRNNMQRGLGLPSNSNSDALKGLNKNRMPNFNSRSEDSNEEKSPRESMQDAALQAGTSAAIQSAGIPAPVANAIASQVSVKKIKKQFIIKVVIACLPFFMILMFAMVVFGGDSNSSYASSGMANDYLYGSGGEDALYSYLQSIGHCSSESECKDSDGAKFYTKLKEKLNSNSNLTKGEADAVIIAFIGYNRGSDDMFKAIDEIDFIANILTKNGAFHIDNLDSLKDSFIKYDDSKSSYFDKYRSDILSNKPSSDSDETYRNDTFARMVQNAKNITNFIDYVPSTNTTGGTCSYYIDGQNVSNIKVRLLTCGASDNTVSPIASEELIDFEKYITGVVYAENGGSSYESLKAQAIAARNYALNRGSAMGNSLGLGLKVENGQYILSIRNCTYDQVYCDPDKGCWSDSSSAGGTVFSSYEEGKNYAKGALGENSIIRKAVTETSGEVMVDDSGKIIYTPFTNTEQNKWNDMAEEGKDYFEILKATYSEMSDIKKTCSASTGEYASWKQCGMSWSNIEIGSSGSNICNIGCLLTSISIEIAKSGTQINASEFNPGVFVSHLNTLPSAFTSGGGLYWSSVSNTTLVPNFKFVEHVSLSGSKSDKASTIKKYEDMGYYIVIKAKSNEHWVALDHVDGDNVYIFDPGSNITNIWDSPNYDVVQIALFSAS